MCVLSIKINQISCYCASERFNAIFFGLQKNFIASTRFIGSDLLSIHQRGKNTFELRLNEQASREDHEKIYKSKDSLNINEIYLIFSLLFYV